MDQEEGYWHEICQCSLSPSLVLSVLSKRTGKTRLPALEALLSSGGRRLECIIQRMALLALEFPSQFPSSLPILVPNASLTLSQRQIGCILANAFFCAFDKTSKGCPSINFDTLFTQKNPLPACMESKFQCLFQYFDQITTTSPLESSQGSVTFHLQKVTPRSGEDWCNDRHSLGPISVHSNGKIEEQGQEMLQLDFANRWIGGGVLGRGLVQEEILFLIKPECIAARLFTPVLQGDQALFIIGAEQYSAYEGYRDSFRCTGSYHDTMPRDALGRRQTEILAIDALDFSSNPSAQYSPRKILRELNKALAGFTHPGSTVSTLPLDSEIATGNWGCGAFSGDLELKFLIQWTVASRVGRPVSYFTFGNDALSQRATILASDLICTDITVGQIVKALVSYDKTPKESKRSLFDHVQRTLIGASRNGVSLTMFNAP